MKDIIKRLLYKLTSIKVLLTIWSSGLITFIVVTNAAAFNNIALALCGIALSFFVTNEVQKYLDKK